MKSTTMERGWKSLQRIRRRRWSAKLESLCEGLGKLLASGLPLPLALHCLQTEYVRGPEAKALFQASRAVEEGIPLSVAWKHQGSELFLVLLRVSEITGQLSHMMTAWALTIRRDRERSRAVLQLCGYPAFVLLSNLSLLVFVGHTVLPTFASLYSALGHSRFSTLNSLSAWLNRIPLLLFATLGAVALWSVILRTLESHSTRRFTRWIFRLTPGVKLRNYARTRFLSHILSSLLDAGLPLMDTLEFLRNVSGPSWLVSAADNAHSRLLQGQPIKEAFSGDWHISMPMVMGWAEHSGDLPNAFRRIEEISAHAVDVRLHFVMRLAEPVFLLIVGGLILYTVTLVFVPLYEVLGQVEQFGMAG